MKVIFFLCCYSLRGIAHSVETISTRPELPTEDATVHLPLDYYAFRLLDNLYFNITSKELSSSFLLFHKIQEFCSSHRSYLPLQQLIADSVIIGCYELLKNDLLSFISNPATSGIHLSHHILTSVHQTLEYFSFNSHPFGLTRHLFDKTVEERSNPLQLFSWRADLALLLPLSCDLSLLSQSLASVYQNYEEDVLLWMNIHVFAGLDPLCTYPPNLSEILHSLLPCHQLVVVSFTTQETLTEKFDFLTKMAYEMNCQFFLTLHPTTIILQPYSFWLGVVRLLNQRLLPNPEGFGYVVYLVNSGSMATCSFFDKQQQCQTSVSFFGRSHVQLFVSPEDRTLRTDIWSWTHCERQGYSILACMLFFCEIYTALKSS